MRIKTSKLSIALVGFLACLQVSRGTTISAASVAYSDVSAAVASAKDGDTVTIPSGSATWTSTLNVTHGIVLSGSGATNTLITCTGDPGILIKLSADLPVSASDQKNRKPLNPQSPYG